MALPPVVRFPSCWAASDWEQPGWLAGIGLFAVFHRTAFIAVALVGLGGAAVLLWRQRQTMKPAAWAITGAVWLIGAVLFYYGYTYV